MKKEDYHHLTSKYSFLSDYEERYRKELISFINEAFDKHGNEFEYKCPTHNSWKEADEEDEFDAMSDLPTYLMVDNGIEGLDEVYVTRVERTEEGSIYIDGYDYSTGEFVTDYYTNSHIDDLQSIAAFINAVLEQDQEQMEDSEEEPSDRPMSDIEKAIAYVRKNVDMDEVVLARKQMAERREPFFRVNHALSDAIYDLMEEYGDNHCLPEGWWLDEHDEESVLMDL